MLFISSRPRLRAGARLAGLLLGFGSAGAEAAAIPGTTPPAALVQTASGPVLGVARADGVSWKGIPYAAAPVDALRWAPPVDPTPWGPAPLVADSYGESLR